MSNSRFFDPSHQPSEAFRESLKKKVLTTYYAQEKSKEMKKNIFYPFIIAISGGMAVVLIAILAVSFVLERGAPPSQQVASNDERLKGNSLTSVLVDPEYDSTAGSGDANSATTMSMTLQAEDLKPTKYKDIEEASKAVGFTPLVVASPVDGEALTELYSYDGLTFDMGKRLYLTFGDAKEKRYEMIQSQAVETQDEFFEGIETIELTVMGQTVKAIHNQFWDESTPEAERFPGSPRQSLTFTVSGVSVDLTDYGTISLDQLKTIAASLRLP